MNPDITRYDVAVGGFYCSAEMFSAALQFDQIEVNDK